MLSAGLNGPAGKTVDDQMLLGRQMVKTVFSISRGAKDLLGTGLVAILVIV